MTSMAVKIRRREHRRQKRVERVQAKRYREEKERRERARLERASRHISLLSPKVVGCPVMRRVKSIKQPYGGYIPSRTLSATVLGDGDEALSPDGDVSAILIGIAVDYLTRLLSGSSAEESFDISLRGAWIVGEADYASSLLSEVRGLDDVSVRNAIRLAGYDVCFRAGPRGYKPVEDIWPDEATIGNVRTMVGRALAFLEQYGPKTVDGFTFEGGYTDVIVAGDGDFLTEDTLWDFKVSKRRPTSQHTLQLLVYWRMGLHSVHPEFQPIKYLGIFNPRLNTAYRIPVADIPQAVIDEVEQQVIGYW